MRPPPVSWSIAAGRILVPREDGSVWLLDEELVTAHSGVEAHILTMLDVTTPESDLLSSPSLATPEEILQTLARLARAGLVHQTNQPRNLRSQAALLPLPRPVDWIPLTQAGRDTLASVFSSMGITLTSEADRVLGTTDDYFSSAVADLVSKETRPLLLARVTGRGVIIGPALNTNSGCWPCLTYWLRTRRWLQAAAFGSHPTIPLPHPAVALTHASIAVIAGQLSLALLRWSNGSPEFNGRFRYFDLRNGSSTEFDLTPQTGCNCLPAKPQPLEHWTNPLTGIVQNLAVSPHPFHGQFIASATCVRPLPRNNARPFLQPGRSSAAGETPDLARTRCIAESLERWSSVWHGDEPAVVSPAASLPRTIAPAEIHLWSPSQIETRHEWNRRHPSLFHVPEPLNLQQPQAWVEYTPLGDFPPVFVPAACTYMWFHTPAGFAFGLADSNGCAAGQTMDQAILGALLELIERDAVSIWWDNRLLRPSLDWAALADPQLLAGVESLPATGRHPVLLDLTTDLGIPAFAAIACLEDQSSPVIGCAAHWDPLRAARRAFAELLQNLSPAAHPEDDLSWAAGVTPETHPFLFPHGSAPVPAPPPFPPGAALPHCLSALARAGIQAYWFNLTRPEIGLPVCRVIAPGLRHCWQRHAPGRLFQVPVQMGWLPAPLSESALNPQGCPL